MSTSPDTDLVKHLDATLRDVLGRHVRPGSRVVLIDFPQHRNAGDSAIFTGELTWIKRAGLDLVHVCSLTTYDAATVRREVGDGILLLHGGGNFGDVWPYWHALRERVAADFPDQRIVQLPQTVHYSGDAAREEAQEAPLGRHEGLTIVARDHRSRALAEETFANAAVDLAPDMAFAIGPLAPRPATTDVLWLARDDHESAGHAPRDEAGVLVTDWALSPVRNAVWWGMWAVPKSANVMKRWPRLRRFPIELGERLFRPMAQMNVDGAARTLSQGRVVISDRLHAHIISLLLGRPNVVLDNSYGKLSTFIDAWTSSARNVTVVGDSGTALATARAMTAT